MDQYWALGCNCWGATAATCASTNTFCQQCRKVRGWSWDLVAWTSARVVNLSGAHDRYPRAHRACRIAYTGSIRGTDYALLLSPVLLGLGKTPGHRRQQSSCCECHLTMLSGLLGWLRLLCLATAFNGLSFEPSFSDPVFHALQTHATELPCRGVHLDASRAAVRPAGRVCAERRRRWLLLLPPHVQPTGQEPSYCWLGLGWGLGSVRLHTVVRGGSPALACCVRSLHVQP